MKNKTNAIMMGCGIFLCFHADAAQVSLNYSYDSGAIISMVQEFEGIYRYSYEFNKNEFQQQRDLSNFYFYVCGNTKINNIQTDNIDNYEIVPERGYFKIDDIAIENENDPIVRVMFDSPNLPTFGPLTYKYSTISDSENVVIPSCKIPEPNVALLGLVGMVFLVNRKRI